MQVSADMVVPDDLFLSKRTEVLSFPFDSEQSSGIFIVSLYYLW